MDNAKCKSVYSMKCSWRMATWKLASFIALKLMRCIFQKRWKININTTIVCRWLDIKTNWFVALGWIDVIVFSDRTQARSFVLNECVRQRLISKLIKFYAQKWNSNSVTRFFLIILIGVPLIHHSVMFWAANESKKISVLKTQRKTRKA